MTTRTMTMRRDRLHIGLLGGLVGAGLIMGALTSCATPPPQKTAAEHQQSLGSAEERKLTLGVVQSSIKEGMAQADVAEALGSPNIVTTDADGNETWIYDKIATETSSSTSSSGQSAKSSAGALGGGLVDAVAGILGVGGSTSSGSSQNTGAQAQTQRTLTVVIKFDADRRVKSVRSQASSF